MKVTKIIQLLLTDADGPGFEQLLTCLEWDLVEALTMENRDMLIYNETVMTRRKN